MSTRKRRSEEEEEEEKDGETEEVSFDHASKSDQKSTYFFFSYQVNDVRN